MRVSVALLGVLIVSACAGSATAGTPAHARKARTVTVMTRNLYLGANLDPIVGATSVSGAFRAVEAAWAQVQANDFRTRARGIAAEVARARPDFVGFQELVLYRTQTPSDFLLTRARTVVLDYERELQKALAAKRLHYRFAGVEVNTDAELPAGDPPAMDIRLTVRNGLLVKKGIRVRDVRTGAYATTFPLFKGLETATRGWVSADATIGGRSFRVITTHLESFDHATSALQAQELLDGPAKTRLPVIVLGDLNSRPDGSTSQAYPILTAAGFRDAWTQAQPSAPGLTCCHGDDLRADGPPFKERIDYVLTRGGFTAIRAAVTGEAPSTRVGSLWPSDHGGLWATLRLPRR